MTNEDLSYEDLVAIRVLDSAQSTFKWASRDDWMSHNSSLDVRWVELKCVLHYLRERMTQFDLNTRLVIEHLHEVALYAGSYPQYRERHENEEDANKLTTLIRVLREGDTKYQPAKVNKDV